MGDREPQGLSSSFPSSAQCLLDWDLYRNVFHIDLVLSTKKKKRERGSFVLGGLLAGVWFTCSFLFLWKER
jgi:hypothetical protein